MHKKIFLIINTFVLVNTSIFAYMVTNTKEHDGYSESKLICINGRETFIHKTPKGYYSAQYKRYDTFKGAANSSCEDKKYSKDLKDKTKYLKHNANLCKTQDSMERILSSHKAYHHSVSRACFLAMDSDTVKLVSYFDNEMLIDRYYKVEYQDELYFVREDDIKFKKKLDIALPYVTPINQLKSKTPTYNKEKKKNLNKKQGFVKNNTKKRTLYKKTRILVKKKIKKVQRKVTLYYCRAISESARGWVTSSSMEKAKRGALHQCAIRSNSSKPCWIETCYKK